MVEPTRRGRRFWIALVFGAFIAAPATADNLADRFETSRQLARACSYDEAIAVLDQLVADATRAGEPATSVAALHLQKSHDALAAHQFKIAETAARSAISLGPGPLSPPQRVDGQASLALSQALAGLFQSEGAEAAMLRAEMIFSGLPDTSDFDKFDLAYGKAAVSLKANQPVAAMVLAEEAFALAKGLGASGHLEQRAAALLLADISLHRHNPDRALELLDAMEETGLTGQSDQVPGLLRARAHLAKGAHDLALAAIETAEMSLDKLPPACQVAHRAQLERARGEVFFFKRAPAEAEEAFRAARAALGGLSGDYRDEDAILVYYLGFAAQLQGNFRLAERMYETAIEQLEATGGNFKKVTSTIYSALALVRFELGDPEAALSAANLGVAHASELGQEDEWTLGHARAGLGFAHAAAGDIQSAKAAFEIAFNIFERFGGAASGDIPPGLVTLGNLALDRDQPIEAQRYFARAVAIQSEQGWRTGVGLARTYSLMAEAEARMGDIAAARISSSKAVGILADRIVDLAGRATDSIVAEQKVAREIFLRDLRLRTSSDWQSGLSDDAREEIFAILQMAGANRTAGALGRSVVNRERAAGPLGALFARYRALVARRSQIELVLTTQPAGEHIRTNTSADLLAELTIVERDLIRLRGEIETLDADFFGGLEDDAVKLSRVQSQLDTNEVICVIQLGSEQSYLFVLSRSEAHFFVRDIGEDDVREAIETMQQSLEWEHRGLASYPRYPGAEAADLFTRLLDPIRMIVPTGHTIYFVKSGDLAGFPMGVLLTAAPETEAAFSSYPSWPWFMKRNTLATVPSVSAFVKLREARAGQHHPDAVFLGIGAPSLGASGSASRSGPISFDTIWNGSLASSEALMKLDSLPNAEAELREIASAFGNQRARLLVGSEADEGALKEMDLTGYSVISFATHGLVSGELSGTFEPGIVLTPPSEATVKNDGFLSASEVAALRLNAQLVLLSACSTAETDGRFDGEPLSGLARAFFMAGTDSIIATHWRANDRATRFYMRTAVGQILNGVRASEAANQAQRSGLDDRSQSYASHPSIWGPYDYIGSN